MRVLGAFLGFAQGLIVAVVALMLLSLMPGLQREKTYFVQGLERTGVVEKALAGTRIEKYARLAEIARDPGKRDALLAHPEIERLVRYEPVRAALTDTGIQQLVENRNFAAALSHPKVDCVLRDPEFKPFVKQLERFCPYGKAEHLLSQLDIEPGLSTTGSGQTRGETALTLLSGDHWDEPQAKDG